MSPRHALRMTTDRGYAPNAPGWTYHVVAWNELPRDVALTAIERVVLLDLSMEASMPTVLRELPNVRSLSTDAHLLAFTPADMPELAELQIGGTSEITLPTGPWRGLTSVEARDAVVSVAGAEEGVQEADGARGRRRDRALRLSRARHARSFSLPQRLRVAVRQLRCSTSSHSTTRVEDAPRAPRRSNRLHRYPRDAVLGR